ncbi:DUF1847 domain-containing protein [Acidobacteriota bacterium]
MVDPKCAKCKPKLCTKGITDEALLPDFCPIINHKGLMAEVKEKYKSEEFQKFFHCSAMVEKECYDIKALREEGRIVPLRPRIREIAEFAKKIEAKKIGLAFCSGLIDEGGRVNAILEKHGLDVCSAMCSCGALDKSEVGLPDEYRIFTPEGFEASCNPLMQAELLNKAGTAFNVLVGLCVGHDMLFSKYCEAPVTTLIVKDRLTGHNPVISLYTRYHRDLV